MSIKKQEILQTALSLFYHKGIHEVGINEVIKAAGVAKKTMYHHFSSKEKLVLDALELRDERFLSWLKLNFEQAESGEAALIKMFHALTEWFNDKSDILGPFKGCFFINTSAEYRDDKSAIYQACQSHKVSVNALIKDQVDTFIMNEVDAMNLTSFLSTLKEGCITAALVQNDKQAAEKAIPIVKSVIANPSLLK